MTLLFIERHVELYGIDPSMSFMIEQVTKSSKSCACSLMAGVITYSLSMRTV